MGKKVAAQKNGPKKKAQAKKNASVKSAKGKKVNSSSSAVLTKLGSLPNKDMFDLHYWADYIELKCLFNKDGTFSKDDFLDDYRQRHNDLKEGDVNSTEELDGPEFDFVPERDRDAIFVDNCFKIIECRVSTFGTYYPFEIPKSRRALVLKKSITMKRKQYLFLLFSSALKYTGSFQKELTSAFELFSLKVLKNLLPQKAEVHLFGSGNKIAHRRYKGTLWNKIVKLHSDLNEGAPVKAKQSDFPPNSTGDAGLDLIGFLLHGDKQPHVIAFCGQAACTENWDIKQFTSSYEAWKNRISFSVRPLNFVFAPFSLRNAFGEWHRRPDIGDSVLLDRQRLLYHFNDEGVYFKKLPSYKVIDQLLAIKESAFN